MTKKATGHDQVTIPFRKISETLMEFAEPLLKELPVDHSIEALERVIKVATCVWNACALDQWHEMTSCTDKLRNQFGPNISNDIVIINALIARKKHLYGDDPRAITNETVVVDRGEFRLRAEARVKPTVH